MSHALYRGFQVYRRCGPTEMIVFRCFERLEGGSFVVQSADRVRLPYDPKVIDEHEREFWTLLIEADPVERAGRLFPTVEEAIAGFAALFESEHQEP